MELYAGANLYIYKKQKKKGKRKKDYFNYERRL